MNYLLYIVQFILLHYTSSQVVTLGGRNFIPSFNNQNCNIPLAGNFASNAGILANIGQGYDISNNVFATPLNNNINANLAQELLNSNSIGNLANANIAASNNIGLANGNIANTNIGLAGNLANSNLGLVGGNIANANIGLASSNVDGDTICNNAVTNYANVVKPPREYGIEFSSGALSVGGVVEVSGRMPFNTNVAVNGAVPAQGLGAVDYKCNQLSTDES